jgi:hypothetical protein
VFQFETPQLRLTWQINGSDKEMLFIDTVNFF